MVNHHPRRRRTPFAASLTLLLAALGTGPALAAAEAAPAAPAATAAAEPAPAAAEPAKPKQYLAVLRLVARLHVETGWTPEDHEAVNRHFVRLQEEAAAGRVILAGRTTEPLATTMGLIVFEAADTAAAKTWLEADPAVDAGVMEAELHPYSVAVLRK